jgi:hypothetical protein
MQDIGSITDSLLAIEEDVINNIAYESVEVYRFLQDEFSKGNVIENHLFQFVYRSFYRLDNAGLSPALKEEYFRIMEELRNKNIIDPADIVKRLYQFRTLKDKNSVQFSFTTKLINTINNRYPIYDAEVARVFEFPSYYIKDYGQKMQRYEEQYQIIQDSYKIVMQEDLLHSTICKFEERFECSTISEVKKLDFIFWSFGKILKKNSTIEI